MTGRAREGEGLPPGALLAFAVCGYGALVVCVLGFGSLLTETDVIATPGIDIVPGVLAVVVSVAGFGLALQPVLRRARPRFTAVIGVMAGVAASYCASLWLLALLFGAGAAASTAAVGQVLIGWQVPLLAAAAGVAAWVAVAVRRTRARPPRWPWERHEGE
ncbi:hypothetical protein N8K70_13595 [Microbacterium betulae]|uniref:Uncharacterized protein n=1 Tax=Microbacterium betulae TaxID=2981139 RepID=A0AA97FGU4_9MICO|nr:hypothetical protein [Microbacterium sp. AB]WOF22413.1 hypothetical protein N8K70_13595 [Microbacterium sp. AB]